MIESHKSANVNSQVLQLDLNHCSEEWGGTPLKVAASLGHVGIVTSLVCWCVPIG